MIDTLIRTASSKFSNKHWKTDEVRKLLSNPSDLEQEPCYICGEHESITVIHHVVPVSDIAKYLNIGWVGVDKVSSSIVWLCPNCHAYVHEMLKNDKIRIPGSVYGDNFTERLHSILVAQHDAVMKMLEKD